MLTGMPNSVSAARACITGLLLSTCQSPCLIRRQDTVCEQTQATEVGETRSLGETREHWQMEFGCEAFKGKVFCNSVLDGSRVKRSRNRSHARVCILIEQISKPESI